MDYLQVLDKLSKKHMSYYVAVPNVGTKQKKMLVTNYGLYQYYLKNIHQHESISYQRFLKGIFDRSITLTEKDLINNQTEAPRMLPNNHLKVFKEYESCGLKFILGKYLIRIGENQFRNKSTDAASLNALIYIMGTENYIASLSGYSGFYQFVGPEQILLRLKKEGQ